MKNNGGGLIVIPKQYTPEERIEALAKLLELVPEKCREEVIRYILPGPEAILSVKEK